MIRPSSHQLLQFTIKVMLINHYNMLPNKDVSQTANCSPETFRSIEESIGISPALFAKKFIFAQQSNTDAFLLAPNTPSPSQLAGIDLEIIKKATSLMSELLFKAGESLQVPISTTIVAISIAHFYFSRRSLVEFDLRDCCLGAMFLACKSEETLRKSYQVAAVFDYVFKAFEGQRQPIRVLELNSPQYQYLTSTVLKAESDILFELGFEVYRLFDIPHRYIGILLKSFDRHAKSVAISQLAWSILNDCYKTQVCLHYSGQMIAAAAVYMALSKLRIAMPPVPWWILLEASHEVIKQIIIQVETLYEHVEQDPISLVVLSQHLETIGLRHGLVNVFPVTYYRKITLDQQSQLRISSNAAQDRSPRGSLPEDSVEKKLEKKHKKKKDKLTKDKKNKKKKKSFKDSLKRNSRERSDSENRSGSSVESSISNRIHNNNAPIQPVSESNLPLKNEVPVFSQVDREELKGSKDMQVQTARGLLQKVNFQLKKHQMRRQKEQGDSDEELLADLIKIKQARSKKHEPQ